MNKTVICYDGFSMSVQASKYHYSNPKNDQGPWFSAEIGGVSKIEPLLMEFAENAANPLTTVYGWVPTEVVWEVVEKHGGLKSGEIPAMKIGSL